MTTHEGKIAIVTGGKQGIGRGVADLLAKRGAKVVLVNREKASEAASSIGNGAIAIAADVTKEADWTNVANEVEATFGRADILVHAAGIYPMASLDEMTPEKNGARSWRSISMPTCSVRAPSFP
ncbi:SDR family NAD(P)-dependent oxidoreductase (plasmid) [Agrobacterium vitis]|uniref:SDR family NAD(P)-dependent oxidoreductase n=1 Tax=Rhizobium/Agrobacterium group TaxID=227290 RepID=UPI001F3F03C9|nr:SDR family NAD(P)-dependent oxidoreductase [Allorhizobium ampelinum]